MYAKDGSEPIYLLMYLINAMSGKGFLTKTPTLVIVFKLYIY